MSAKSRRPEFRLNENEIAIFEKLSSPIKIQDFLNATPTNYEKRGETVHSPRMVIREEKAHCIEGAMLAAAVLWYHGEEPLRLNMVPLSYDDGHVIAPYKRNGFWGAISKTNHSTVRFRDPVYASIRELAMSYFHEYSALKNGVKTLRKYSEPFNMRQLGTSWITETKSLIRIDHALDDIRHFSMVPKENLPFIKVADQMERRAGDLIEWSKDDPRT
jgi:hypothetical protein